MEGKKKIVITASEARICKLLAVAGLDDEKAEAEAKGIPFDYETVKTQREQEFIRLYAEEIRKKQNWEATRDKAFHSVISGVITSPKLDRYVHEHVPDLKAFREMDPAEILKVHGYGQKTADELSAIQARIQKHPKILTRLNKAIEAQRRMYRLIDEYKDIITMYNRLRANTRHTRDDVQSTWRYYGG